MLFDSKAVLRIQIHLYRVTCVYSAILHARSDHVLTPRPGALTALILTPNSKPNKTVMSVKPGALNLRIHLLPVLLCVPIVALFPERLRPAERLEVALVTVNKTCAIAGPFVRPQIRTDRYLPVAAKSNASSQWLPTSAARRTRVETTIAGRAHSVWVDW